MNFPEEFWAFGDNDLTQDSFEYVCLAGLVLFAPYRQCAGKGLDEGPFDLAASTYSEVALASEACALELLLFHASDSS